VDAYLLELRGELLYFVDSHRTGLVFALPNPDKPGFRGVGTTNLDHDVKYDVTVSILGEICFMVEKLGVAGAKT
jgi:hypothetical protein